MNLSYARMLLAFLSLWGSITTTHAGEAAANLTDLAALSIQDQSIKKLRSLLSQYRGTRQEPELLNRLSDLYLERSGISFRISEGTSLKNRSPLYTNSLRDAARTLTELLQKYPSHAQASFALFKRGKAYKELGMTQLSRSDYLELRRSYPEFDLLDSALMDLADFAQDANEHAEALRYLSQIEKLPHSEYHALSLHKSAWSYFNLAQFEPAIQYLKKEIEYYSQINKAAKNARVAETAFVESAFHDLALFHFEAINKKSDVTNVSRALELFKELDSNQQFYGKTVLSFAKLLKAYSLTEELQQLNARLIKKEKDLPETAEVTLLLYQYHFEHRNWNQISPLIADLKLIKNDKVIAKMEQTLSSSLAELHKLVLKNKQATERGTLVRPLAMMTEALGELFEANNPSALLAQYSLAETLFELGEYREASARYQTLLKPEAITVLETKKLSATTLHLRLLASRYRELKQQELIPEKLKIQTLASATNPASKEQLHLMQEWIDWVCGAKSLKSTIEEQKSLEAFTVEANKLVYLYFNREEAVKNLIQFGLDHPESPDGVNALSIALDTLSQSEEWARVVELSKDVAQLRALKAKDFKANALEVGATAHLKITQTTQDPSVALTRSLDCIQQFESSKIGLECRIIHAKALLNLADYKKGISEIDSLMPKVTDVKRKGSLLLLRADALSHLGHIDEAMKDLDHYQELSEFHDREITERLLNYRWYKGDSIRLNAYLKNKNVCRDQLQGMCEQFRVVQMLDQDQAFDYGRAFRNTIKAEKEVQAVWSLMALKNPKKLPFQDRLILLQRLAQSWENLSALQQIHLFPKLVSRVKETMESIRISSPGIAPLHSDQASIERRMRMMQELDLSFSKVMKLNWIEIKKKGADELALIYERLISDLKSIQTPPDLLKPFADKLAEFRAAGEKLDQMAFDFKPTTANPLLSAEAKAFIPEALWNEWKKEVDAHHRDYLFQMLGTLDPTHPDQKSHVAILRGLILAQSGAPTEAYALIETASESPWKTSITQQFVRRKP